MPQIELSNRIIDSENRSRKESPFKKRKSSLLIATFILKLKVWLLIEIQITWLQPFESNDHNQFLELCTSGRPPEREHDKSQLNTRIWLILFNRTSQIMVKNHWLY